MADRIDELLTQLKAFSPIPDDEVASGEVIDAYHTIITELADFSDARMIQPLLASFAYSDAYGVCWEALELLETFSLEQLLPAIPDAIRAGQRGSRMWIATLLGRKGDARSIPVLMMLLHDPEDDVRTEAVKALAAASKNPQLRQVIAHLRTDPSLDVRLAVVDALAYLDRIANEE